MAKIAVVFDTVTKTLKYKQGTQYVTIGLKDILEGGNDAANKDIVDIQQVRCERVVASLGVTFMTPNESYYLVKMTDDGTLDISPAP